jgi:predicted trehalose synthase
VKAVLLEKEEVLATANGGLQKVHTALAEVHTALAQKENALIAAQTQLQQDRTTLEGARSWQAQAEQKAQEVEKLSVDLHVKVMSLAAVEEQLRQERSARQQTESQL